VSKNQLTLFVGTDLVSVFAMSAFVALKEKGLAFEIRKIDLKGKEQLRSEYQDISMTCRVPTLVHEGFCLSESSAIAEYLDDAFSTPKFPRLYPAAPQSRARARQVQAWLRSDFMPIRSERPADLFYFPADLKPLSEAALASADKLLKAAGVLIDGKSEHLFDEWCMADTDLAVMLNRLVAHGHPVPETIMNYVRKQWARPSVEQWVEQDRT
jgi:glutathione S-transferase